MSNRNQCDDCAHNIGTDEMDCEFGCAGVTTVEEEGRLVVFCEDYKKRRCRICAKRGECADAAPLKCRPAFQYYKTEE